MLDLTKETIAQFSFLPISGLDCWFGGVPEGIPISRKAQDSNPNPNTGVTAFHPPVSFFFLFREKPHQSHMRKK